MSEYSATYDAVAARWDAWSGGIMPDVRLAWARHLELILDDDDRVVELGCGTGVPVAKWVAARFGYTGIDASEGMLDVARRHVPAAAFVHAEMESVRFEPGSLGAVIAFYAINHVPRVQHADLFASIASWLRPGGMFVASVHGGAGGDDFDPNWLDAGPMAWSGFDGATTLEMLRAAGLAIEESEVIDQVEPGGTAIHPLWFVARKPH